MDTSPEEAAPLEDIQRRMRPPAAGVDERRSCCGLIVALFGTVVPKWSAAGSLATKLGIAEHLRVDRTSFLEAWAATFWDRELGRATMRGSIASVLDRVMDDVPPGGLETAHRMWTGFVRRQMVPRPGALTTLRAARSAGLRVGLVSNAGPAVPPFFRKSEIADVVDVAVFSCDVGAAKPDPTIYLQACGALAVEPEACVYVGDGGNEELQGGVAVGMNAVLLHVRDEVAREGLPDGARAWNGPVVEAFEDILVHVEAG